FPAEAWAALTDWSGEALSPTLVRDKVVVFVTWKSWYASSVRVLPGVQRLASKHPDDVVVIGVHDPKGYEGASKIVEREGLSFPMALDAEGRFRSLVKSDQDPDLYIVDRAGQLRYADIDTGSLDRAVEKLIAETTDAASGVNARLAEDAAQRDLEFRRTVDINQDVALMDLPVVPFEAPGPEAYQNVRWPSPPRDDRNRRNNEEQAPRALGVPAEDSPAWASGKAPLMDGRARVVYFWNPFITETYRKVMPAMDLLQRQHGRDVAVVGVLTPEESSNDRNVSDAERQRRSDPVRLQQMAREFKRNQKLQHAIFFDPTGSLYSVISENNGRQRGSVPVLVAVVSSDGVARWWGSPFDDGFKASLDRVLRVDPGVQARRAAEEAYIRNRK
ncbi:MAG: hypothetical protein KDA28_01975, partial [Phycisphaerales bacterium]|nr:hypothetical protein [Phycisphaerales bacterium]